MSQNSTTIQNTGTLIGLDMVNAVNAALDTIATNHSGAGDPGAIGAHKFWPDLTNGVFKQRNAANTGWILRASLAETLLVSRSSNTILAQSDFQRVIAVTGSWTQTFGACADLGDGWYVDFKNEGTGTITFDPNGAETIDVTTLSPGESCRVVCNGTLLKTIGRTPPPTRNYLDNPDGAVFQRGSNVSMDSANSYANSVIGADRWHSWIEGTITAGSVCNGNATTAPDNNGITIAAAGWTSAKPAHSQNIPGADCDELDGAVINVSGQLYHNIGSARTINVEVHRPTTTIDTFSALTLIGSFTFNAPDGASTAFSGSITLGATDARKGLQIRVQDSTASTMASTAYFALYKMQVRKGGYAPYEARPYEDELRRCQWFLPSLITVAVGYSNTGQVLTTSTLLGVVDFKTRARVPPTGVQMSSASNYYVLYDNSVLASPASVAFNSASQEAATLIITTNAAVLTQGRAANWGSAASALTTMLFTGSEL